MKELTINGLNVKPGDFVVTKFSGYEHWSIVSDKICDQGKYMLISATKRTGTVLEEAWDIVTGGKETGIAQIEHTVSVTQLLERARSQIGKWKYTILNSNCEGFVNWVYQNKITSKQVVYGVGTVAVATTAYTLLSKNPKLGLGALLIGGATWFGVQLGKSKKK